jgi:hypothetical protein
MYDKSEDSKRNPWALYSITPHHNAPQYTTPQMRVQFFKVMRHLDSFHGQEAVVSTLIFAFFGGLLTLTPLLATSRAYPQ